MKAKNTIIGVVNCLRLHIHSEPNLESEVVCKERYLTELVVDLADSTKEFYRVYTVSGIVGFCQKHLVTIKQ